MKLNKFLKAFTFSSLIVGLTQCTSTEIGESKDVAQDKIYQDYFVSYDEGQASVSATCHYRFAGKDGTTLVLSNPSNVTFDGTVLKVDSNANSGAFYQISKPVEGFYGKHTIVFSDINNKKFTNDFSFDNFKLSNIPQSAGKNQPLRVDFETSTLKKDDYIELSSINTDSSFSVSHDASDSGNYIIIPAKQLARQKGKILEFTASLHREIPMQQSTPEGGKMSIYYALKPVKINLK